LERYFVNKYPLKIVFIINVLLLFVPHKCVKIIEYYSSDSTIVLFMKKGSAQPYYFLRKYLECMRSFETLQKYFKLSAITAAEVEKFVYKLYGARNLNIDDIRYTVFYSPSKITQYSLPPTKEELNLHAKRANYQAPI